MATKPLFIAFEGGDGSGKSTQAAIAAKRLGAVLTKQAGGTPFGQKVRALTLDPIAAGISLRAEAALYMSDRAQLVDELVEPALKAGKTVVTDRYAYSSIAYQGYGRGLDVEELTHLADWSTRGIWPDVVVFIDVPVEVALARAGETDHYEAEGVDLQRRLVAGYHEMATADPKRWVIVDGDGTIDDVAERVQEALAPFVS